MCHERSGVRPGLVKQARANAEGATAAVEFEGPGIPVRPAVDVQIIVYASG